MQAAAAAAAVVAGRFGLQQPVLRTLAFGAGLAARAATRTVESVARLELLLYATREITLAHILLFLTATFEDVDDPPEPPPLPGTDILGAVLGGVAGIAGAFFVVSSIADAAVPEHSHTRNEQKKNPYAYALTGPCYGIATSSSSSSYQEAPATAAPPPRRGIWPFSPPPRRAVAAPFDASRAIAAWIQECEAAGIKHRMHQRK